MSIRCTGDLRLAETLAQVDREDQLQEQYDRMVTGKYNRRYREIRESEREEYLKAEHKGRDQVMIARFRCGNEELQNKCWKEDEDRICRIYKEERETIEHMIRECKGLKKEKVMMKTILKGEEGTQWMRMVLTKRREKEGQGGDKENSKGQRQGKGGPNK